MAIYIKGQKVSSTSGRPVELIGTDDSDGNIIASDVKAGKIGYARGQKIVGTSTFDANTSSATAMASDILSGKTAYVKGNKIIGTSTYDADTKDATATAEDILEGKTAYVNGQKVIGIANGGEGPHAWGKYDFTNQVIETIPFMDMPFYLGDATSIKITDYAWQSGDNVIITVNCHESNDNFSKVFSNVESPESELIFTSSECGGYSEGEIKFWQVEATDGIIFLTIEDAFKFLNSFSISIEKKAIGDFIEYVVDDEENAYPVDGELDGFWYKKFSYGDGAHCWMRFTEEPEIPVGFTYLESLTTTGTQYFDSGYYINTSTSSKKLKVVADMALSAISTSLYYVSGHGGAQPLVYFGSTSSSKFGYGNGTTDAATSITADTNRHTWTLDYVNGKFTVDSLVNVTFTPPALTASNNFFISAYNQQGTVKNIHGMTIYSWEFYESEKLVKRLIPVLDLNGTPCLYDTIGKQTIYAIGAAPNAGTELGIISAEKYIIDISEDAYPEKGYHTDGYYYVKVGSTPVKSNGIYCWQIQDRSRYSTEIIPYITANTVNTVRLENGWTKLRATTNGAFTGNNLSFINTVYSKYDHVKVDASLVINGASNLFISVINADTHDLINNKTFASTNFYTVAPISLYMYNSSAIQEYSNGTQNGGTIINYTYGDMLSLEVRDGKAFFYKNGVWIYTSPYIVPDNFYIGFTAYNTNYNYIAKVIQGGEKVKGYVISNDANAYPNNAYGDDGLYYSRQITGSGNGAVAYSGTEVPTSVFGNDGDIFIVTGGN